jgi:hypothetical protein
MKRKMREWHQCWEVEIEARDWPLDEEEDEAASWQELPEGRSSGSTDKFLWWSGYNDWQDIQRNSAR